MELIADTTFLIGLWRNQPWAVSYAKQNSGKSLGIPWVVFGEFWNGAIRAGHDTERVRQFLGIGIPLLDAGSAVESYARIAPSSKTRASLGASVRTTFGLRRSRWAKDCHLSQETSDTSRTSRD